MFRNSVFYEVTDLDQVFLDNKAAITRAIGREWTRQTTQHHQFNLAELKKLGSKILVKRYLMHTPAGKETDILLVMLLRENAELESKSKRLGSRTGYVYYYILGQEKNEDAALLSGGVQSLGTTSDTRLVTVNNFAIWNNNWEFKQKRNLASYLKTEFNLYFGAYHEFDDAFGKSDWDDFEFEIDEFDLEDDDILAGFPEIISDETKEKQRKAAFDTNYQQRVDSFSRVHHEKTRLLTSGEEPTKKGVARITGLSKNTVKKYWDMSDHTDLVSDLTAKGWHISKPYLFPPHTTQEFREGAMLLAEMDKITKEGIELCEELIPSLEEMITSCDEAEANPGAEKPITQATPASWKHQIDKGELKTNKQQMLELIEEVGEDEYLNRLINAYEKLQYVLTEATKEWSIIRDASHVFFKNHEMGKIRFGAINCLARDGILDTSTEIDRLYGLALMLRDADRIARGE